ncbi:MAG: TetR/AcrR family transcriptional regulator [Coriobacteriales bacterium]|nr:TetR/AcrR family transcriptional regulator [Coriobacteriales bacterium]
MDQRQRKSRDAIFSAFGELLVQKDYEHLAVSDIVRQAHVGRTTFYAHFDTKDALLDEFCSSIFEHVFSRSVAPEEHHDYSQTSRTLGTSVTHLLQHIAENDHGVADLLRGPSGEVVLSRLQRNMYDLASGAIEQGELRLADAAVPRSFLAHHLAASLTGTIHWWLMHGMHDSPAQVASYYLNAIQGVHGRLTTS